jgi:hypothetical protein
VTAMLTSFSKVLEKALYNRLIEYLNNNNILNSQQFGFRKNLATEDAIVTQSNSYTIHTLKHTHFNI